MNKTIYAFDKFQVDTQKRVLRRDGQTVQMTSKAFDLLTALIESGGREVTKNELMEAVWANQIVEDANLTVTMSHVRKALGERANEHRFIVTIPGRGYRFIGELKTDERFVIEQHTASQIIIEHQKNEALKPDFAPHFESQTFLQKSGQTENLTKNKKVRFLSGAIMLGLLLGGFGFWRYKPTAENANNLSAKLPFAEPNVKQLTTKGRVSSVAISPDGKFYAYTLDERTQRKNSLWVGQTGGDNDLQLRLPDENRVRGVGFSLDSQTLYYAVKGSESESGGLFKIPVLGGVAEKVSDAVNSYFTISPDGKQIAFFRSSGETSKLLVANLDGTGERELVSRPKSENYNSTGAAWSPDGAMLAFGSIHDPAKQSMEIFTVRVADGKLEKLTDFQWLRIGNIVWQNDGKSLIAVATEASGIWNHQWHIDYPEGKITKLSQHTDSYGSSLSLSANGIQLAAILYRRESNLWFAPADNLAEARQVTFSSINGIYGWNGFDWMPDGSVIFTAEIDQSSVVCAMNADAGNFKKLTGKSFFDQDPTATADGRFIVFQSNRSGTNEIWRINSDGTNLKQLTTGGGNIDPHTTPDSQWVYYVSARDGKNFVRRISIEGGESVQITDKFSDEPSISPDGKFIACGYKAKDKTQLAVISIADGKPLKLFDIPATANFRNGIRWLPDGKAITYRDWANGIWRQDLNGGEPQRLKGLPEEKIYTYGWSPDGKQFAFTRGREIGDAVLIVDSK